MHRSSFPKFHGITVMQGASGQNAVPENGKKFTRTNLTQKKVCRGTLAKAPSCAERGMTGPRDPAGELFLWVRARSGNHFYCAICIRLYKNSCEEETMHAEDATSLWRCVGTLG